MPAEAQTSPPLGVTAVMLPELDFDQQIALCRRLGVTHYTFRPRVIRDDQRDQPYSNWGNHKFDLTPQRFANEGAALARQLRDAGLTPFGAVPFATTASRDDEIKRHLEGAAAADVGRVRINPAPYPDGHFDYEAYLAQLIDRYGRIIEWSKPLGLKLVMETHSNTSVSGPGLAYNACRPFDAAHLGVILDLPNFVSEGGVRPHLAVAVLARWIDHVHVGGGRRVSTGYDHLGFRTIGQQSCPIAESDMHIPTWLDALREAGVQVPLIIEDYTRGVPGALRLEIAVTQLQRILTAG